MSLMVLREQTVNINMVLELSMKKQVKIYFIRNLLIRPKKEQLKDFKEDFLILVAPGCKVDYKKIRIK